MVCRYFSKWFFLFIFKQIYSCIGEGNGNRLQCSCLENPRDGGAWWAAVYGVAQSQTRLKQLSSSSSSFGWFIWGVGVSVLLAVWSGHRDTHFLAEMSTASDRRLWVDSALASPLRFWEFLFWLHEGPGIFKPSSLLPSPLGFASLQKSRGKQDTEHPALLPSPSLRTVHPARENHPSFLVGGGLYFDYSPIHFVWALIFLRCLEDFFFFLLYPHVKTVNTRWTGWLCDF